jgi:hypothetical protein
MQHINQRSERPTWQQDATAAGNKRFFEPSFTSNKTFCFGLLVVWNFGFLEKIRF